jgi:hypothetical protein
LPELSKGVGHLGIGKLNNPFHITHLVRKKPMETPTDNNKNAKTCAVSVGSVKYERKTKTKRNNEN